MAIFNSIEFNKKLQTAAKAKKFQAFAYNAANTRLVAAKQELLKEFDNNEVIKELIESSNDPSIQDSAIVSKGNITAALGLKPGEATNQIKDIRKQISNGTKMDDKAKINVARDSVLYSFKVKMPIEEDIYAKAKLYWTSKSWIEIIESGISPTLQKFIFWWEGFNTKKSKSGTGLQTKGNVENVAELTPTPFISKLLDSFRARFSR